MSINKKTSYCYRLTRLGTIGEYDWIIIAHILIQLCWYFRCYSRFWDFSNTIQCSRRQKDWFPWGILLGLLPIITVFFIRILTKVTMSALHLAIFSNRFFIIFQWTSPRTNKLLYSYKLSSIVELILFVTVDKIAIL